MLEYVLLYPSKDLHMGGGAILVHMDVRRIWWMCVHETKGAMFKN